ncbi:hypothetical protein OG427_17850 [Streptomyces sp. NBC_00133]|uniref:hypothetical protein n=1 Tax=Streptomyces sp. NBC_00133 TaxID=2903624 RepID=UPI003251D907
MSYQDFQVGLRRFGPDFVLGQQRRYGKRPPEQRELSYDIAVLDEYATWRDWLDQQLDMLPDATADTLAKKLWFDQHFWPVVIELAVGAGLRSAGLRVVYDREWDGLTPDWTVVCESGEPLCLVEVLCDSPPQGTFGQLRGWYGLVERIKQIPVSVVLALEPTGGPIPAPEPRTAKRIAQDLRRWLMQPLMISRFTTQGYTFLVQAKRSGGLEASPFGLRAYFAAPSSMAGVVSARQVANRVEEKVRKYRHLSEKFGVPLVVGASAHRFTGIEARHLDDLLSGRATMSLQFNFGDVYFGEPTEIRSGRPERWEMPSDLAGVLWAHNQPPFDLAWRANPAATLPAPQAIARRWRESPASPA